MPRPLPAPPPIDEFRTLEDAERAVLSLLTYLDMLRQQLSIPPPTAAVADEAGTADLTYSQNEVDMLNNLKAKVNSILAALRGVAVISE